MKRLTLGAIFLFSIAACDRDPTCGRDDLRYSRELGRCTCVNGGEYVPEELVCILPDGAIIPLGDGGVPLEPDACVTRSFHRDGDGDGFGDPTQVVEACDPPAGYVENDDDCADDCAACRPGATEVCDAEERDESCSGGANEGCACTPGASRACPGGSDVGECAAGTQSCGGAGVWSDCAGAVTAIAEACNGLDDDCDTVVDGPTAALACGSATRATSVGCTAGECVVTTCATGYADCDGDFDNGCEQELGTVDHCAACGDACAFGCEAGSCLDALAAGTGATSTCALRENGTVVCWGPTFEVVPGITTATSLAVGPYHACVVLEDRTVRCWGSNFSGQIDGSGTTSYPSPVAVVGLTGVAAIAAGDGHTCALGDDRRVRCWGSNGAGQLGDGTTTPRTTPTLVPGLTNITSISTGSAHTCAVDAASSAWCWGLNRYGQLGDGTTTRRESPVRVSSLGNISSVRAGNAHTCAVRRDGTMACWGANSASQLGDGTTMQRTSPVTVIGATGVVGAALGFLHTCLVRDDGTLRCWGNNEFGQLADGTRVARTAPTLVEGVTGAAAVVTEWTSSFDETDPVYPRPIGTNHVCAVGGGRVWCWGYNQDGELGDGTLSTRERASAVLLR